MPKPSFLKLILAFVVVLAVAGVGYAGLVIWRDRVSIDTKGLVGQEKTTPEGQPTIEPPSPTGADAPELDTSDWKTYCNEEFGFEMQHPPYLNVGKTLLRAPFNPGIEGTIVSTLSDGQTTELVVSIYKGSLDKYIVRDNPGGVYYRFDERMNRWISSDQIITGWEPKLTGLEPRLLETKVKAYGYRSGDVGASWQGAVVPYPQKNYVLELILVIRRPDDIEGMGQPKYVERISVVREIVNTLRFTD